MIVNGELWSSLTSRGSGPSGDGERTPSLYPHPNIIYTLYIFIHYLCLWMQRQDFHLFCPKMGQYVIRSEFIPIFPGHRYWRIVPCDGDRGVGITCRRGNLSTDLRQAAIHFCRPLRNRETRGPGTRDQGPGDRDQELRQTNKERLKKNIQDNLLQQKTETV